MNDTKIISSLHGFTKGKSCLINLIKAYDVITGLVDERRAVDTWTSVRSLTLSSRKTPIEKLLMYRLDEQTEVDGKPADRPGPEDGEQWHEVQLETSN